jgi:2-dehydro-3-deoxyphosphogluconate aldolase/(4S)-4-hydroxy-2-oxoglutarate aldolase
MSQNGIRNLLLDNPVVPVVKIQSLEEVEPLVTALQDNNINCIEITLRTDCAVEAIKLAKACSNDNFSVGAGTVVNTKQLAELVDAGVDFIVLPGLQQELVSALQDIDIPFLPGVVTPSEMMEALRLGWDTLKFFPANIAGGLGALKTYGQVFSQIKFCPTGGITKENYPEYLDLDNVISVGGSWIQKDLNI